MATSMSVYEKADRLIGIQQEIKELADEALGLVRGTDEFEAAKAYWYAQITMALNNNHGYLGSGSCTMNDSAEALTEELDADEEDES